MKLFGFEITRARPATETKEAPAPLDRGWWPLSFDSFPGAWQQGVEVHLDTAVGHHTVFTCCTLIASDIAKLPLKYMRRGRDGIWRPEDKLGSYRVLAKPNAWQTRAQFFESWMLSKLQHGNTYVLKERADDGSVLRLHVLHPARVTPKISTVGGEVFYELAADNLADIREAVIVPAEDIIHDRWNTLFHPLVGLSPIYASGLSAVQSRGMQRQSSRFFANAATPSGILTAPGAIGNETAARLKAQWDTEYRGANAGKVAVLGDGLKFERMALTSVEAQLIEQLKWNDEVICRTFHVPAFKVGVGPLPSYNNVQALNLSYYSDCLQSLIEAAECALDEGLDMDDDEGVEFDLDNLLRMDSETITRTLTEGVKGSLLTVNEARRKLGLGAVAGGDTIYMQQQNFSLEALSARDRAPPPTIEPPAEPEEPKAAVPRLTKDERPAISMDTALWARVAKTAAETLITADQNSDDEDTAVTTTPEAPGLPAEAPPPPQGEAVEGTPQKDVR